MRMAKRRALFLIAALGLGSLYARAIAELPAVGEHISVYGAAINARALPERNVLDAVSAVNFDYRAIDTLGEEFILFASVLGVLILLREQEAKDHARSLDASSDRRVPHSSDAVWGWAFALTGITVLFGIYTVTHGQLSPGGGFQGGVILATAPLLIYLARDFNDFRKVVPHHWLELSEAIGAAGFVGIGLSAWLTGASFLQNTLPLGTPGSVFSGGTIPLISLATGFEVAGGFLLLLTAFLQYAWAEAARRKP